MKTGAETYSVAIEDANNYTQWVLHPFRPHMGPSLLEVGLGHGGYRKFLPEIERYVGVDIDRAAIEQIKRRRINDHFICADITKTSFVDAIGDDLVDTVLCVNVLEHINEHALAIQNLTRCLVPGGYLLILVPAFDFLFGKLDSLAGHIRRYDRRSLLKILPSEEYDVESSFYFNAIGALGWWINGKIEHGSLNSDSVNGQIRFFDRYVIPAAKLVDACIGRRFGQSLVLIARRRS